MTLLRDEKKQTISVKRHHAKLRLSGFRQTRMDPRFYLQIYFKYQQISLSS